MTPRPTRLDWTVKFGGLLLFLASTNYGVLARLGVFWDRGNALEMIAFTGIWTVSIVGLVVAALLPALWMRALLAVPIAASTFIGNAVLALTREHLSFYDVVLYWAERTHWLNAADTYALWFAWPAIKALFGLAIIAIPPRGLSLRSPFAAPIPLTPFAAIVALLLLFGGKGTQALPEQFSGASMVIVLTVWDPLSDLDSVRRDVAIANSAVARPLHIFFVVDESIRADFLDLNGAKGVTPYLASQAHRFANFGFAVAGNNCSLFSNLILRFGGIEHKLAQSIRTGPSIWSYARAAGYRTVYIDGQQRLGKLQNGMTIIEREDIDEFVQFPAMAKPQIDVEIARKLREISTSSEPRFVFVNKWGSHFPYVTNFPSSEAIFQPQLEAGESIGSNRQKLRNSYANAVHWVVDNFMRELLAADFQRVALIYTGDHGQNLMDRGITTHCNSSNPHYTEGVVPLLLLTDEPELAQRFAAAAARNRDRATHFHIFPTLLQLLGFHAETVRSSHGPGLLDPLPPGVRRFSYGAILSDGGQSTTWREVPPDLRDQMGAANPAPPAL